MVFDKLGNKIQESIQSLQGSGGKLTEDDIEPVVKEIQRSLFDSDVEVDIVLDISDEIRERAIGTKPAGGVTVRDHVLKIVYDVLVEYIGESTDIPLEEQDILLMGVQGAGKTTTSAKIAWWFKKKGLNAGIIQTDTQRPGAHEQTEQLTEDTDIPAYTNESSNDPIQLLENGLETMEEQETDVNIVDTAGRHNNNERLVREIEKIDQKLQPDLRILVLDGGTGQSAKDQIERFDDSIGIDGVVITKMDGSSKGGGALTATYESDATVSFLGIGEKIQDIERFDPEGFISRILGMGDIKQLSERVERAMHEMDDEDWEPEDILEGEFTLYDMKKQVEAFDNMGRMKEIVKRIPGFGGGILGELDDDMIDMQEKMLHNYSIIIDSMTEEEIRNPNIINSSRKERIARGSGKSVDDVEQLLQQYHQMKNILDQFDGREDMEDIAKNFGSGGIGGIGKNLFK